MPPWRKPWRRNTNGRSIGDWSKLAARDTAQKPCSQILALWLRLMHQAKRRTSTVASCNASSLVFISGLASAATREGDGPGASAYEQVVSRLPGLSPAGSICGSLKPNSVPMREGVWRLLERVSLAELAVPP